MTRLPSTLIRGQGALLLLVTSFGTPATVSAQEDEENARPSVFFDCDGRNCSSDYYRTEIPWVNWVRDRPDADLHVIVTSSSTGSGGREYQFDFSGIEPYEDYDDQLFFRALPTDTEREELDGISHTLGVGLARFASLAGYRGIVQFQGQEGDAVSSRVVSQGEVDDPWNLWVFRVGGNANLEGETREEEVRLRGSVSATRVSPTWNVNFFGNVNFNRVEFDLEDETFVDERTDWNFFQSTAYALADHWSVQLEFQSGRATRFNQDFRFETGGALEYSIFPYEEATRRAFTFRYTIGPGFRDYIEPTIFGQTSETRWEHSARVDFSSRQTWGDASVGISAGHFLYDFDRNTLRTDGNIEFRVVRGFNVDLRGEIEWVDNQIYLPADDGTDEERLLRLQQQATSFNFELSVGFSFQFGSVFNNVVNNRFRQGDFGR